MACLLTPSLSIVGTAVPQVCLQPLEPHGPPATQTEPLSTRIADVKRRAGSGLLGSLSYRCALSDMPSACAAGPGCDFHRCSECRTAAAPWVIEAGDEACPLLVGVVVHLAVAIRAGSPNCDLQPGFRGSGFKARGSVTTCHSGRWFTDQQGDAAWASRSAELHHAQDDHAWHAKGAHRPGCAGSTRTATAPQVCGPGRAPPQCAAPAGSPCSNNAPSHVDATGDTRHQQDSYSARCGSNRRHWLCCCCHNIPCAHQKFRQGAEQLAAARKNTSCDALSPV